MFHLIRGASVRGRAGKDPNCPQEGGDKESANQKEDFLQQRVSLVLVVCLLFFAHGIISCIYN